MAGLVAIALAVVLAPPAVATSTTELSGYQEWEGYPAGDRCGDPLPGCVAQSTVTDEGRFSLELGFWQTWGTPRFAETKSILFADTGLTVGDLAQRAYSFEVTGAVTSRAFDSARSAQREAGSVWVDAFLAYIWGSRVARQDLSALGEGFAEVNGSRSRDSQVVATPEYPLDEPPSFVLRVALTDFFQRQLDPDDETPVVLAFEVRGHFGREEPEMTGADAPVCPVPWPLFCPHVGVQSMSSHGNLLSVSGQVTSMTVTG